MVFSLRHTSGQGVGRTGDEESWARYIAATSRGGTPQVAKADQSRRSLLSGQLEVYSSSTRGEDNMGIDIAKRVSRFQLWLGENSDARCAAKATNQDYGTGKPYIGLPRVAWG